MISLMKASAGSGKTFNLTKTYISLLLNLEENARTHEKGVDPRAYRHILAVTFTNKATDEMKSRILKELHVLSTDPKSSDYLSEFYPSRFSSVDALQAASKKLLVNILHDYSAFSVSTIDKFFQQTLRAFSREIGQFSSYQVELDKDSLVTESVDRVLDSLSEETPALLQWLKEGVMANLEEGKKYSMEKDLASIAKSLKSDKRRTLVEKYGIDETKTTSRDSLRKTRKALKDSIETFEKNAEAAAKAVADAFASVGMNPATDTSRGCIAGALERSLSKKDFIASLTPTAIKNASDYSTWFRSKEVLKYAAHESLLLPLFQSYVALLTGKEYKAYKTAISLSDKIHDLGIANELNAEYAALLKEKNIMCLDDSNTILRNIIDGSDAPFVYEKLGTRYDHFLLDEFQDTSKIQWDNFKPLVLDSDSRGGHNLLVGDVKQSIYRWRGSDWDLMAKDVPGEIPNHKVQTLTGNYRSLKNVVEFNNGFFQYAAAVLDNDLSHDNILKGENSIKLAEIYSDVAQTVEVKDPSEGSVDVLYVPDETQQHEAILSEIQKARANGAKYSDIAIVVRKNEYGSAIAAKLLEKHIPVISDEALKIKSSVTVRRLISLMSLINNPSDTVGGYYAQSLNIDYTPKGGLGLYDMAESLLRKLREAEPQTVENELQYIQAFMDEIQSFVSIDGNNLSAFLKKWAEKNPSIGSPAGADAIRIMTIHKSKGLEFPFVILPYVEKSELYDYKHPHWSHPDVDGTSLDGVLDDVYNVILSKSSADTLFEDDYKRERYLQYIDSINTYYVAMTRAGKALTIISSDPVEGTFGKVLQNYLDQNSGTFTKDDSNQECIRYSVGSMYDFSKMKRKSESDSVLWVGEYPSYPINPEAQEENEKPETRLQLKVDAVDFFGEDGKVGNEASPRRLGLTLHEILSSVRVPEDLEDSVRRVYNDGRLTKDEANWAYRFLKAKIAKVKDFGWFPDDPSKVVNETAIVDTNGNTLRPDRVVFTDNGVIVVDYKFAKEKATHVTQVTEYAELYRQMGYKDVSIAIWYVYEDLYLTENLLSLHF